MTEIPETHADLLTRPLYCHLATVSPAGRPQSNPMWFVWDGSVLRFTHTNTRRKFRQLQDNPNIAISVIDPDSATRYIEVRATVTAIEPDPTGSQYTALAERYGRGPMVPPDAPTRVVLIAEPYHVTTMG
jgi:PPOX class probable F420-dependent enzyme